MHSRQAAVGCHVTVLASHMISPPPRAACHLHYIHYKVRELERANLPDLGGWKSGIHLVNYYQKSKYK